MPRLNKLAAAHRAIALFYYVEGVPLSKSESPYFRDMLTAVAACGHEYKPLSLPKLKNDMLDSEANRIKWKLLKPHMEAMQYTGCSVTTDGTTDLLRRPVMAICATTPAGCILMRVVDCSGIAKTGEFIAGELKKCVEEIGPEKVIQVVSDAGANYKSACGLIGREFPNITVAQCTPHTLDTLLRDLSKNDFVAATLEAGKQVVDFINNHHAPTHLFKQYSNKTLHSPAATRFVENINMLKRLVDVKSGLQSTVEHEEWQAMVIQLRGTNLDEAAACRATVLDETWWLRAVWLLDLFGPINNFLCMGDTQYKPVSGKIYHAALQLLEHMRDFPDLDLDTRAHFIGLVHARCRELLNDLHRAAYAVNPEFWGIDILADQELLAGFNNIAGKVLRDDEAVAQAAAQLLEFRSMQGCFADPAAQAAAADVAASTMPAHVWWEAHGVGAPELQQLAVQVLAQVSSTASCEHVWSTQRYLQDRRRGNMDPIRSDKLLYVMSNMPFLRKAQGVDPGDVPALWQHEEEQS